MAEEPSFKNSLSRPDIDPIALDDETVFGLDPAVHWLSYNRQQEQFPSVVIMIVEHWNDADWLHKLLQRTGYNPEVYDELANPRGIYELAGTPNLGIVF